MVSYTPHIVVYLETLQDLLENRPPEESVLAEMRATEERAREMRERAARPGFLGPSGAYIPAYGSETEIEAMKDYCGLLRISRDSKWFSVVLHELSEKLDERLGKPSD